MLPLKWQRRAHEHSQTFKKHAQLTLHGTNLVQTDKAHFGDACLPVAANAFRVEGMNINDLPLSKDYTQSHSVVRAAISDQAQICLLQEIYICWAVHDSTENWHARLPDRGSHVKAQFACNTTELDMSSPSNTEVLQRSQANKTTLHRHRERPHKARPMVVD